MEKDIIIYYSKYHKLKWFISLSVLSAIYLAIFLFIDVRIFVGFHFLFLFYLVLVVISLLKPYIHIKNNKIKSSNYMFKSLNLDEIKEVNVSEHSYFFNQNHKSLFIDLDLVSNEDRLLVIAFLKKKKLL